MRHLLLLFALVWVARSEIVDRVAVVVGQEVITEQQIDEEIRVTALLNHQPILCTSDNRRAAADRLIQQLLIRREVKFSHYPAPELADIDKYFERISASFGSATSFAAALTQDDLTAPVVKEHLALQLATVGFIEYRFRPDESISDTEIQSYYQRESSSWKNTHPGTNPPSLAASNESIRKALAEEHTDELMSTWLEERRKQVTIVYVDKSLQ